MLQDAVSTENPVPGLSSPEAKSTEVPENMANPGTSARSSPEVQ